MPGKQLVPRHQRRHRRVGALHRLGRDVLHRMRGDMFFGTQDGRIMQADRTGYDNGMPYVATLVGGWEMFQSPSQTMTWRQARASFRRACRRAVPAAAVGDDRLRRDRCRRRPAPAPDPGLLDLWDRGCGTTALWDAATPSIAGGAQHRLGVDRHDRFQHAPIVQVTVAQQAKPEVDLIIDRRDIRARRRQRLGECDHG